MSFYLGLISSQLDDIEEDNCISNACYPSTGDLLVGRGRKLYASSTCGENGPQRYCTISKLDGRSCTYCDSRSISPKIYQHLPEFMEIDFNEKKQSWWQSENGQESVYLQVEHLFFLKIIISKIFLIHHFVLFYFQLLF